MSEDIGEELQNRMESMTPRTTFDIGIVGDPNDIEVKALRYAFTKPGVKIFQTGSQYDVEDIISLQPAITFVCTKVEVDDDGLIIATELEDQVNRLMARQNGGVITRSNLTPDLVDRLANQHPKYVHCPNIYFDEDSIMAHTNVPLLYIGGSHESANAVREIFLRFSNIAVREFALMSAVEAAFVDMSVRSFLAVKSQFFNDLYNSIQGFGGDYNVISNYVCADGRINNGMNQVPNIDLSYGVPPAIADYPKILARWDKKFTLFNNCDIIKATINKEEE